ncbi:MAG: M14/M99 family metallopeptidase [Desulfobacterota bacterium]|nr:M14/M99 family metallopeptidase [Thermodesulfobacteriota bacterium]
MRKRYIAVPATAGRIIRCMIAAAVLCPLTAFGYDQHQVFFQNTDYELNVYRIHGAEPGTTMLIIGGMQGDEPGGYLAADLYVEMTLRKGNLIIVPRANFCSILLNVRGVNGDMNRKFANLKPDDHDSMIIQKLKDLIAESDVLLNLHDGSGFYSPVWESDRRNPLRYGQSVIADCERFPSRKRGSEISVGDIARAVCVKVNREIANPEHHFHFNNHQTAAPYSPHKEQRKSATYFAVNQIEIPAFGIETSKDIPSARDRVRYQSMVINAFMEQFGIVPEQPSIALPDPVLKYLFVSVNDQRPVVVFNGETLRVRYGDTITVLHVEANYERGLSVDVKDVGSYNDMRKRMTITKETEIIAKKDNMRCGTVAVAFESPSQELLARAENTPSLPPTADISVQYLIMRVNEQRVALRPGEHRRVRRGDRIIIDDLVTVPFREPGLKVNFRGFVGNQAGNDAEDRGYVIDTGQDLIARYSKDGHGLIYTIEVLSADTRIAEFFIDLSG